MWSKTLNVSVLIGSLVLAPIVGCESLPGDEKSQGTVIGGLGGALAGAAVAGDDDRAVGALIGAVVGAGGGYLVGAKVGDKNEEEAEARREEALRASKEAEENPASAEAAADAVTADVNDDGFVTLDEVVAMEEAGLTDEQMIQRLRRTQQYFKLNDEQETFLRERGVNDAVIIAMRDLNRDTSDATLASDKSVDGSKPIGRNAR